MSKTDEMTKHHLFMGVHRTDSSQEKRWAVEFLDPYAVGEAAWVFGDSVEEACGEAINYIKDSGWIEVKEDFEGSIPF